MSRFKMVVSVSSALAFTHRVILGITERHRGLLDLLLLHWHALLVFGWEFKYTTVSLNVQLQLELLVYVHSCSF